MLIKLEMTVRVGRVVAWIHEKGGEDRQGEREGEGWRGVGCGLLPRKKNDARNTVFSV